jgi:hypothetical protein
MRRFKGECAHSIFNRCPIYAHDGASAKFSTNSHKTDYSAGGPKHTDPDLDFQQLVNGPLRKEEAFFLTFRRSSRTSYRCRARRTRTPGPTSFSSSSPRWAGTSWWFFIFIFYFFKCFWWPFATVGLFSFLLHTYIRTIIRSWHAPRSFSISSGSGSGLFFKCIWWPYATLGIFIFLLQYIHSYNHSLITCTETLVHRLSGRNLQIMY